MTSDLDPFDPKTESDSTESKQLELYHVTVFNNEYNTFEEVIFIMKKAIFCSHEVAEHIAWEIHNKSQATIMIAPFYQAKKAAGIISTIGMKVKVTRVEPSPLTDSL